MVLSTHLYLRDTVGAHGETDRRRPRLDETAVHYLQKADVVAAGVRRDGHNVNHVDSGAPVSPPAVRKPIRERSRSTN